MIQKTQGDEECVKKKKGRQRKNERAKQEEEHQEKRKEKQEKERHKDARNKITFSDSPNEYDLAKFPVKNRHQQPHFRFL